MKQKSDQTNMEIIKTSKRKLDETQESSHSESTANKLSKVDSTNANQISASELQNHLSKISIDESSIIETKTQQHDILIEDIHQSAAAHLETQPVAIIVNTRVKTFPMDQKYQRINFLDECLKENDFKTIDKHQIIIHTPNTPPPSISTESLEIPFSFTFGALSADEIVNITNQILKITYDPLNVAKHLKKLDSELGQSMQEKHISFDEKDSSPDYLLAGRGHFIPGAPQASFCPKKKGRLLDKLLLEHEKSHGINLQDYTIKFVGFVGTMIANEVVAGGSNLFSENKQINRVLLHGSYSHRLCFEALTDAAENGDLNLELSSGKTLTFPQLLEILVYVKKDGFSLWEKVVDSVEDTFKASSSNPLDPNLFDYSCRSPFVLNSLLLCFGKELGLPNLQSYLLDSHYKAVYQMVLRTKEQIGLKYKKSNYSEINIPNEKIYERCMEYFSTMADSFGDVGGNTPFTLEEDYILIADFRYKKTSFGPGTVQKISPPKEPGLYPSWKNFFQEKAGLSKEGMFANRELNMQRLIRKYKTGLSHMKKAISLENILMQAAKEGNASDIQQLLDFGVDPNVRENKKGQTALHKVIIAANKDDRDLPKYMACFKILLEKGAKPDIIDLYSSSSLKYDKKNLFQSDLKQTKINLT